MRLDHVNIRTDDLDASTAFYRDIIGLEVGPRPSFSFAGAWLYHDGQAVVHLKSPAVSNAEGPSTSSSKAVVKNATCSMAPSVLDTAGHLRCTTAWPS